MAASWQPIYDSQGVCLGHRSSVRDITRRKQAEEREMNLQAQLAHMGRLSTMGEMASGLAHELNQPLAAIVLQAQALPHYLQSHSEENQEMLLESLKFVAQQAQRAGDLVRRMRQFVRNIGPRRSTLTFLEVLDEVVPLVEKDLREVGIALTVEIDPSLPQILGDKIQLQQVLLNVVRNAMEAMQDTPVDQRRLNIEVRPRGGLVEVAVRDTGCGIPTDKADGIDELFGTFYTTKPEGMGMGLGIARSIVEAHGGHLWAEPNPDRGTTFAFTLPIPAKRARG
jgi:C4-dicarboxylate-specific signal transduction histidine kinase